MFVRDWMAKGAVTLMPNTMLWAALGQMNERKIRRMPIVDGRRLVGIITKSDIYATLGPAQDRKTAEQMTVEEIMAKDPLTVSPGNTLEDAALLMHDNRVSGLPVVDKKRVVGIITETDIFRAFIEIMGIREKGARILMKLKKSDSLIDQITKRVKRMKLRSLVTYRDPKTEAWTAVARIRGRK